VQISCENTTEDDCESESKRKKSLTNATKELLTLNSTCQADDFSHVLSQDQIYVYYDDWIPKGM